MKIIRDLLTFNDLTGCTFSQRDLERFGIPSEYADAAFSRSELPKLKEFCARSEGLFHIISRTAPMVMVNHLDERAFFYHLGNGSKDPSLCFYDPSPLDPHAWKTSEPIKLHLTSD